MSPPQTLVSLVETAAHIPDADLQGGHVKGHDNGLGIAGHTGCHCTFKFSQYNDIALAVTLAP